MRAAKPTAHVAPAKSTAHVAATECTPHMAAAHVTPTATVAATPPVGRFCTGTPKATSEIETRNPMVVRFMTASDFTLQHLRVG